MTTISEGNLSNPSNGSKGGYSNGSNTTSLPRGAAGATNGHKPGMAVNGSSKEASNGAQAQPRTYFGHDREEVTRLLIQALSDMGYQTAAEDVSQQSGFELESPTVAGFRSAILNGSWPVAEQLLTGASYEAGERGNGLVLAQGSDRNAMRFWIRQQKFLELLENRDTTRALMVLRGELTPLSHDTSKLHFLSSLLMCRATEDLKAKADWDGASGQSRRQLLSELSKCISPSVMLPENRLAVLLEQVKQSQIDTCLYHTEALSPSLYSDHYCDNRNFPVVSALLLHELEGEIWQVLFSPDGSKLAAAGGSEKVVIWDSQTWAVLHELGDHNQGVGKLAWSPDGSMIVTCSQDKHARIWNSETGSLIKTLPPFEEPVSGCVWSANSERFVIGSLGRSRSLCTYNVHDDESQDWGKKHRVQDLCGSPDGRWLVAVDDQQAINVYNAVTRELDYHMEMKARPTSVMISQDSRQLLVNRRDGETHLIDLATRRTVQRFFGHKGGDFLIRSSFGGANESFVVSGSEDGCVWVWHKNTGAAVEKLTGHTERCNAVTWNPADPTVFVSAGDDRNVCVWTNPTRAKEIQQQYQGTPRFGY